VGPGYLWLTGTANVPLEANPLNEGNQHIVTCILSQGLVRRLQVVSDTNSPRVLVSATSN
jgi:hypothetical protein